MLQIVPSGNVASVKSYFKDGFSRQDCYTGPEDCIGVWKGLGAERLGLYGEVMASDFNSLCDNRRPGTDDPITPRTKANRRVGYDITVSCPKSFSVLHALTGDEDLPGAFNRARNGTMAIIERDVQTRVRTDGQSTDRTTANIVWAQFTHNTTRPIDGWPDPQWHGHCFVFNMTEDTAEVRWKAAQLGGIKHFAGFYEAVFLCLLASELHDLGYETERRGRYFEVAGVPRSLIERFSRRSAEIKKFCEEYGIDDPATKAKAAVYTRASKGKGKGVSGAELRDHWLSQVTPDELAQLRSLRDRKGPVERAPQVSKAVEYAMNRQFERLAVVPEKTLLEDALRSAPGRTTVAELKAELDRCGVIRREQNGITMVTTPEVLKEEEHLVKLATDSRGTFTPLFDKPIPVGKYPLNDEQLAALNHIGLSRDGLILLNGGTGVGKSTLMKALKQELGEQRGWLDNILPDRLVVVAPTGELARGVLRADGFPNADTVASFLNGARKASIAQELVESRLDRVLFMDEVNLTGTRTMTAVMERCAAMNMRIIACGDSAQNPPVPRGGCLQLFIDHAGLTTPKLQTVVRQRGEYKAAVESMNRGQFGEGFDRLDKMGAIREMDRVAAVQAAAADYVDTTLAGNKALLMTPTHAEGERVTREVRSLLHQRGALGKEKSYLQLKEVPGTVAERQQSAWYRSGQVVQFHQNCGGFPAGSRWSILGRDPWGNVAVLPVDGGISFPKPLPLGKADRYQVYEKGELKIAVGDTVRITRNARVYGGAENVILKATGIKKPPTHELNNGSLHRVVRHTRDGGLLLSNKLVVPKAFGHIEHGYYSTPRQAQGQNTDRGILLHTAAAGRAASREQVLVCTTRGRKGVAVYTDNREELRAVAVQESNRISAMDLTQKASAEGPQERQRRAAREEDLRAGREGPEVNNGRKREFDRG